MASPTGLSRSRLSMALVAPLAIAIAFYWLDEFDPAPFPPATMGWTTPLIKMRNDRLADDSEKLGEGQLLGPEDLAYDENEGYIYTGCSDGWIWRLKIEDEVEKVVVEKWAEVGGRPLGLAFLPDGELVVADAYKGLLSISKDRMVRLLANEAEGVPFGITDGVDVSKDGLIYFTDASYKYKLHEFALDVLGGKPSGRLLSFDPAVNQTAVLARDLYFANGVAVSPTQEFIVFCETPLRRCNKYYIKGEKMGNIDGFIEDLEGFPDNIKYDNGRYWIGCGKRDLLTQVLFKYPMLRKLFFILKYVGIPAAEKNGGVISMDMEVKYSAVYMDPGLPLITAGIKVGEYLYYGSLANNYIGRLNLTQYPARLVK